MASYYEGLNEKLFDAVAPATRVLEIGCAAGRLGAAFKERHPGTTWHGVDLHAPSLAQAATRLDRVWHLDVEADGLAALEGDYDTIVLGDLIEHLRAPETLLAALTTITRPGARLLCCAPNMTHISIVERLLRGDLSYDANGLLDRTHLRFLSPASVYKMLLDAGWLPGFRDRYEVMHHNDALFAALTAAAATVRVPAATADLLLNTYQLIVEAHRLDPVAPVPVSLSIITAVNDETQLHLNLLRSPALATLGAEVIPIAGAASAAEAFERGRAQARGEWLLFCHQDVYLPDAVAGPLTRALAAIAPQWRPASVLGFAGIGRAPDGGTFHAGRVVDRLHLRDWPEADHAISLDELAVVLHRETALRLDASLGWHLWATDLCLIPGVQARVLRAPIFHNSASDFSLPPDFHASAARLRAKYGHPGPIATLHGDLT